MSQLFHDKRFEEGPGWKRFYGSIWTTKQQAPGQVQYYVSNNPLIENECREYIDPLWYDYKMEVKERALIGKKGWRTANCGWKFDKQGSRYRYDIYWEYVDERGNRVYKEFKRKSLFDGLLDPGEDIYS